MLCDVLTFTGANIRELVLKAGGPDDRQRIARMVRFPRQEAEGNTIRVEGEDAVVDKIIASIEAMVNERDSQTNETVEVAPEKHRLLIGRGGETRRNLESQFNVSIDIPKQTVTGPQRSQVKLAGQPADVAKAREHILTLTKDQESQTVQIPLKHHHAIADNGQFFRRLRNDHRVTVDHAGKRPPPKPAAATPSRGGALPLITDDAGAGDQPFSWELHDLHADAPEGEIPWIISGPSPEDVAKARTRLETALAEASKQDSTGYLILSDPRSVRLVIGPGGSEINRIRKETGTKINVPKRESQEEAIEITGTEAGCERAREIILELVNGGSSA